MGRLTYLKICLLLSPLLGSTGITTSAAAVFSKNGFTIHLPDSSKSELNALDYTLEVDGGIILHGKLGMALPAVTGQATTNCDPGLADECYEWGDYAKLFITTPKPDLNDNCAHIEWESSFGRKLEDCFDLMENVHWYGGAETRLQTWPIESVARPEAAHITGDFFQGIETGSVVENYWITSSGVAVHVSEDSPLFTSWNSVHANQFCLSAQNKYPYEENDVVRLKYELCIPKSGENFKQVHQRSIRKYYPLPEGIPDEMMLTQPFWSTWAQYKEDINQSLVIEMANKMIAEGYTINSHIEIDDDWENCYGEAEFNLVKFPDPAGMVADLNALGINRTTVWVHPFINFGCPSFEFAFRSNYFVKDNRGKPAISWWWQGETAGLVDFTNPEAVTWWTGRLKSLQEKYGITSFKFDAGEAFWLPASYELESPSKYPNDFTTRYVDAVSSFGGLVETRSAHQNQNVPTFIRMMDKDSRFDNYNGLQSLIPTLLLFSTLGYPFIMPDMIGGNAYGDAVSAELYIRWAQANTFMPAWQFSVLPWGIDETGVLDVVVRNAVSLRLEYSNKIIEAARVSVQDGSPMNRPMWWVDPEDSETYTIDDQYMLGDDILVAPVLQEGATSRNIYLPKGTWIVGKGDPEVTYEGPLTLQNWPAPIDSLPFFEKIA